MVLCGPQGVRDAFDAVDDGAGEIVGRIDTGKETEHSEKQCKGSYPFYLKGIRNSNTNLKYDS